MRFTAWPKPIKLSRTSVSKIIKWLPDPPGAVYLAAFAAKFPKIQIT
jgi:hypothetical protein